MLASVISSEVTMNYNALFLLVLFVLLNTNLRGDNSKGEVLNMELETLVSARCLPLESELKELALCPQVHKYHFIELTLEQAKRFIKTELELSSQLTTSKQGSKVIRESLNLHLANAKQGALTLEDGPSKLAIRNFGNFISLFSKSLKSNLKNNRVYLDSATYWAPSVEASALIWIDLRKHEIVVVLHGLTDG